MKFLYPAFLFALFTIAIPVIIHLFNFKKYKRVYFPNIIFLKEVREETKKRSKLKHLLVLITRIISIIALVFAFSQPYLIVSSKDIQSGTNRVSIFIDNSFSMESINKDGMLLEIAKQKAREIVAAYQPTDEFQLLTNDFEAKHQRFVTKNEIIELIDEIKISPVSRKISEVYIRLNDLEEAKNKSGKINYFITDLQSNFCNFINIKEDSSVYSYIVPVVSGKTNNIFIDSCWFTTPIQQSGHEAVLKARIRNFSDGISENLPVRLFINNQQRSLTTVTIEPNSEAIITLPFMNNVPGIQSGRIEINDNPIIYDDKFYFSFEIVQKIAILCINGSNQNIYLNTLYMKDSLFEYRNVNYENIDYSAFPLNDLIILNGLVTVSTGLTAELRRYVTEGGSLVVVPSLKADLNSYKNFLTFLQSDYYTELDTSNQKVTDVNRYHPVFETVFEQIPENANFPQLNSYFRISKFSGSNQEYIIRLQNGNNYLISQDAAKGKLYLLAGSLEDESGNFGKNTIFVPAFYNIALLSIPANPLYYNIGEETPVAITRHNVRKDEAFRIKSTTGNFEFIPELKVREFQTELHLQKQIKEAGNYLLMERNNKVIKGLSYNYPRKESFTDFLTIDKMKEVLKNSGLKNFLILNDNFRSLTEQIAEHNKGIRLWKWFIIIALIFIATEVLLLRFIR